MSLDADAIVDRRRLRRKLSFWRVLAILAVVAGVTGAVLALAREQGGLRGAHIARFTVSGFIAGSREEIRTLDRIAESSGAKALVVRINSPGGTTAGAEALYDAIRRVAAKKPVIAVVSTLAASGAYVAAIATDRVVARRNALVGSIGVLYQWPEVGELMKRLGIEVHEVKSSPLKAAPNYFEPPSPEARAVIEDLVRDAYGWFIGLVAERRGLSPDEASLVGNGRVFTGNQALPLKLIDEIGGEDEAIAWLAAARRIDKDLPVRDWRPRGEGLGFDLTTRVVVWLLERIGLSSLAPLLSSVDNPLAPSGSLDGLLSVWHVPHSVPGSEPLGAEP